MTGKIGKVGIGLLALALLATGCGKTQVKITNSTGVTLSEVRVSVYGTGSSNTLTYSNVASGATTDAQNWVDDSNLISKTAVTGYTVSTDSNSLDVGKTNTLTLTLSSGNIVVNRSAQ